VKRSTDRILTTHVGSLIRTREIIEGMKARRLKSTVDEDEFASSIREGVAQVVRDQVQIGIDIPSDGEYGRSGFTSYVNERLSGLESRPVDPGEAVGGNDRAERDRFPEFFTQYDQQMRYLWMLPEVSIRELPNVPSSGERFRVTGKVAYSGQASTQLEIDRLKDALMGLKVEDAFVPAATPVGRRNDRNFLDFYPSLEAYLYAVADALHEEYKLVTDAGFILQLDYAVLNPRDQILLDMPNPTDADVAHARELGVEVTNHALRGIPENMVRYHHCWGSMNHPHTQDAPLESILPLMFKIKAQAYSIEAANPRHEHEWMVWQHVKLPDGKLLIPGVISHQTNVVEHPELVAWRIENYASAVGKENVIAGTDCGFSQFWDTIRLHPSVQWAKLQALVDGAALASKSLWG
jgi:5-methyltetrahydropteroyltriglutamate--homocysteine methyltransferase